MTLTESLEVDTHPNQDLLRQARVLCSFAEEALYPRAGSPLGTPATALILLRESLHLTLAALDGDHREGRTVEELFATADTSQSVLAHAASEAQVTLSQIHESLIEPTPTHIARSAKSTVHTSARRSLVFLRHVLASLPDDDGRALQQRRRKTVGVVAALLALAAIVTGLRPLATRAIHGPDLLEGLSFTTSSSYDGFSAKDHTSHGRPTAILFHTREDEPPWVEYDLGSIRTIHRLEVRNRTDCCGDRASPLVLEGSLDRQDYRELAKQPDEFTDWTTNFGKTQARYVRLRVARKSTLHLERIVIR